LPRAIWAPTILPVTGVGSICHVSRIGVSLDARKPFIVVILLCEPDRALWPDGTQEFLAARAGPNAFASAPPQLA
jgi:hypothetical protein